MKTALKNYRQIADLPNARRLLAADAISKTGDWLLYVAMSVLVYQAGEARMLSLFTALRVGVPFVLGPWAGRWGEMMASPRTVMIAADALRGFLLLAAATAAAAGLPAWVLVALVVGCAAVSAFHGPAERRLQRDVIDPDQRAGFNAVIGATGTTIIVVAPALGGVLSVVIGNIGALVLDAVSFLISLVIVAGVRGPAAEQPREPVQSAAQAAALRKGALSTAVRAMRKDPVVLACVMTQAVACTVAGGSLVLLPLLADGLRVGAGATGWLTSAVGAGSVLGVLVGGTLAKQGRILLCVTSVVTMGVLLGFLGSSSTFVLALLCAALLGAAANLPEPMYWTSYAARVDERDSSAFYGLVESSITGGFACGGIILGAVVVPLGISTGTWTMGLAGTVLASAAFVPALRHRREQTGTAPVAAKAGS